MKSISAIIFAGSLLSASCCLADNLNTGFTPGHEPMTVGRIVAQRFIDVPHPNFDGNPAPTREITYPETCAWLGAIRFAPAVRHGWEALVSHINDEGDIDGVCEGTNRSTDRDFYLKRRTLTGNMHGQAPVLWYASAFLAD